MGARTDADIEDFQKAAGIEPARGVYADKLDRMAEAAFELIKVITLEKSGVRDGNGYWNGSDVLGSSVHDIARIYEEAPMEERLDKHTGEITLRPKRKKKRGKSMPFYMPF